MREGEKGGGKEKSKYLILMIRISLIRCFPSKTDPLLFERNDQATANSHVKWN